MGSMGVPLNGDCLLGVEVVEGGLEYGEGVGGGGVPVDWVDAGGWSGEEAGFDEDLEAVADAEDEFSVFDELCEGFFEVVDDLVGEDFSGGDVVAVGEASGDAEDLVVVEGGG